MGSGGEDAVTEVTRNSFLAQTPESFSHDADSNLTADAPWTYAWDGENRLIAMETASTAVTAGVDKLKVEFAYDAQGRRISKKVSNWSGSAWTVASQLLFLYDGWNMVAELTALSSNAAVRTYVWGLDLSGTFQGAGGVGGLISASDSVGTHFVAGDGNGNVAAYVSDAAGTTSAYFDYNAFGETVTAEGSAKDAFPIRFSTKYLDADVGLVCYGLRYYSPSVGRWLSKDPIDEQGGPNLYAFVGNNAISGVDPLGQFVLRFRAFIPGSKGISLPGISGSWIPGPETDVKLFIKAVLGLSPSIGDFTYVQTDNREFGGIGSATSRLSAQSRDVRPGDVGRLQQIFGSDVFIAGGDPSVRTHGPNYALNIEAKTADHNIRQSVRDLGGCKSEIRVDVWGHYPFFSRPPIPDINFTVIWTLTRTGSGVKIELKGAHNKFPAYEGLIDSKSVYQFYPPDPGPTMSSLTATQSFHAPEFVTQ